ncbi:MAG: hypothetical protein VW270_18765 [Candidatus Poseidoniales archaeon]
MQSYIQAKEMREMIKDINNPQFNIVNVPADERVDCLNQVIDARDNGLITQKESLDIVCNQWYIQFKTAKLK